MKPVSPVIPGNTTKEIIVAEHQDQYGNLPSLQLKDGSLLSRWELTEEDLKFVAEKRYLYVRIWSFGKPLNPLRIDADEPRADELPTNYTHKEAFCLMKYRSKDGTEEEIIWNSRDGVTPFGTSSKTGKEMLHFDWNEDRCVPNHIPKIGDRVFVDLTPEKAKAYAIVNVDRFWDQAEYPMSESFESKEAANRDIDRKLLGEKRSTRRCRGHRRLVNQ